MGLSPVQFLEMEMRLAAKRKRAAPQPPDAAEREVGKGGLQEQILQYCRNQWPPWKVIQARPDQKSTIAVGAHDLTIFASGGRTFLIETKAKGKKPTAEQHLWAYQLSKLGHTVHLVRSMTEFLTAVRAPEPKL